MSCICSAERRLGRQHTTAASSPRVQWRSWFETAASTISIVISRAGAPVFTGDTTLAQLKRTPEELAGWLYKDNDFPNGAFLMTGTGIVPGDEFTLALGDEVSITIEGIGTLVNVMG